MRQRIVQVMKFQRVDALQKHRTLRDVLGRRARQQHRNGAMLALLDLPPQRRVGFRLLVRADAVRPEELFNRFVLNC